MNFSVRNLSEDDNMISSQCPECTDTAKCFWVAKPDIESTAPQIFYFDNDNGNYSSCTLDIPSY